MSAQTWLLFLVTSLFLLTRAVAGKEAGQKDKTKCQEITIPMCKGIGYNLTEMPNSFNHESQEEAGMEVHQYWPLVEIKCSSDLKFFICSLYVPICMEDFAGTVPPCRSVCERAKVGCEPVMVQYGFQWPERMACDRFPQFGKNNLCMDERKGEEPPKTTPVNPTPKKHHPVPPVREEPIPCTCTECPAPLVKIKDNRTETNGVPNCALPCRIYSSEEEVTFSTYWLGIWSGVCFGTTLLTLVTFGVDRVRFKYPERPIVYLSACYLMVSSGYLIRLWKGHEAIACKDEIIRYGIETGTGTGQAWGCTLVFLLIYYFGMASSIWWVVLSLTWYLAAGCKWGSEAIASHAHFFHIGAWVLPALGTLVAVLDGAVDGDAISGICFIGNQDPVRLIIYILAPLGILLILGTSFLLAGFIALVRIRSVIAKQAGRSKTEKLEKLMIRIGVFSVLYTLPASAVIGAHLYEMSAKYLWLQGVTCSCKSKVPKPMYSVLMLKYFMSLAVGITSGVWIWSGKTVESWQRFFSRICGKQGNDKSAVYHVGNNGKNLTHV